MNKIDQGDLALFFDLSLEMLCIAGPDGFFMSLNPAWERVLGHTREELKAKPFVEFVHPDDVQNTVGAVKRLSEGLSVVNFENRYRHKDGSWRWLAWNAATNTDGTIYATARDITDEKDQQQKLAESESRIKRFLEALPIGIYILGKDGKPYYANRRSSEILGNEVFPELKTEELAETYKLFKFGTDELYPEAELPIVKAMSGTESNIEDMEIALPSGRIPIEVWGRPVLDAAGKVEFAIAGFIDITDRKFAEAQMRKLLTELEKSNQDLDQFAYIVSHDLKAPLRAITNLSEWIEEDLEDHHTPEITEKLRLLQERVRLMQSLINDLLEYARIGRVSKQSVKIDLAKMLDKIRQTIPHPATYQILSQEELPVIWGDSTELFQLFSNLIANAVNYRSHEDGKVEISYRRLPGKYEFSISDDGKGIEPRFHERVFELFERIGTSSEADGTGIGLSLVKRLVQENGGEIKLDSKPGKGARFTFTWPIGKQVKGNKAP